MHAQICTAIMSLLYGGMGATGYWSRGDKISGIVIFSLGDTPQARIASAFILIQVRAPGQAGHVAAPGQPRGGPRPDPLVPSVP